LNIDELIGRQLDLAVARHVLGHEVEERPNLKTGEVDAVYSASLRTSNATWVRVPLFSQSPSAALTVELELQKRGWKRTEPSAPASGDVRVLLQHTDGRAVEAFGPMNVALCRAALRTSARAAGPGEP
jgi:hypothetical protein